MTRLIDADALLEKFAKLEAIALEYVRKLNERQDPNERDMWVMWTGILNERTAYKYEIVDAPTVDAVPVRYGEWIDPHDPWTGGICSACGYQTGERMGHLKLHYRYCPNCGARMDTDGK